MSDTGTVNIHGKQYKTVARRVQDFREQYPQYAILTELVHRDDTLVVMKAAIADESGRVIGTGYAEEVRASSNINRTSALENAETSAIGRALAAAGYAGTEYASADEVANAIGQQGGLQMLDYMALVRDHFDTIVEVKTHLANDLIEDARVAYKDLDVETQKALWLAPTKGGIFTTDERAKMKGLK
jgi:deoxycytidylate deaminase